MQCPMAIAHEGADSCGEVLDRRAWVEWADEGMDVSLRIVNGLQGSGFS
jgi:hypothetical protein